MRVLQVHNYYRRLGGADLTVRFDAAVLRTGGVEVVEYSRQSADADGWKGRLGAAAGAVYSPRTVRDIDRICRSGIDVAHVHNFVPLISPSVYGAIKRHGIPIVQTVNDYRMMCVNGLFYTQGRECTLCRHGNFLHSIPRRCHSEGYAFTALYAAVLGVARATRVFARHVDVFVAVSEHVRGRLLEIGIPDDRIVTKGNFGLPEETPSYKAGDYGLYLGRLSREKGLWTLLDALERRRDFPFRFAGAGPEEAAMREHVRARGMTHVEFLGFVEGEKRFDLLRGARFSIYPSEWPETFGISVVESLAVGTPVIVARSGGLPELVADGVTGRVFSPGDAADLGRAMESMVRDAPGLRRKARASYDERMTGERALELLKVSYARAKDLCNARRDMIKSPSGEA